MSETNHPRIIAAALAAFVAIHARDWLAKLLLMSVILGTLGRGTYAAASGHRVSRGALRGRSVDVVRR